MTALAYYLLKVLICSGILCLYYQLALKNKAFHQWNRFYLLSAVAMSLLLPWLQFTIAHAGEASGKAIQLIQVMQSADHYLEEFTISSPSSVSPEQWILGVYCAIGFVLLCNMILSLYRLWRLTTIYDVQVLHDVKFVNTSEPGAPFSFLNYIFWHKEIAVTSETGQHIFQHELVHVREKHTLDKLFLQVILIPFWCNPFFWFIRKELRFIHEFIADKKAVGQNGTAAFAAMILQASYPQQYHSITNPFFQTSIKRRLAMLTKIQNPVLNYISRIIALPLIAITIFAFTVRTKTTGAAVKLEKEIVVAIDAAHGFKSGKPTGVTVDGVSEDALVLQLAEKIKALNKNENIRIVFTRNDENWIELKDRVTIAQNANADIFISLHVNADVAGKNKSGIEVYLPPAASAGTTQSRVLGSALLTNLAGVYKTNSSFLQRSTGIYVLDKNVCPAALVEVGYLTNDKDRNFIVDEKNQEQVAQQILKAIENYAASGNADAIHFRATDTIPKKAKEITAVDVTKDNAKKINQITISYTDGTSETLTEQEANRRGLVNNAGYTNVKTVVGYRDSLGYNNVRTVVGYKKDSTIKLKENLGAEPIIILEGQKISADEMNKINTNTIQSIDILKGEAAINKYGDIGKVGVVVITLKSAADQSKNPNEEITVIGRPSKTANQEVVVVGHRSRSKNTDPVFTQVEVEASVNVAQWRKFLELNLSPIIEQVSTKAPAGTYTTNVRFLVDVQGNLSDFSIVSDPGYGIGSSILKMMPGSPKWNPAEQNGKKVGSYHVQPVTLQISNN